MAMASGEGRGQWGTRLGFILAAAGSAVGLGNIWRFPYVAGENGGGLFVAIYLFCVVLIGLPIMIAEVLMGRATQSTPVNSFGKLARDDGRWSPWQLVGWMGVLTGFIILSYYAVVAGWVCKYSLLAISNAFKGMTPDQIETQFNTVYTSVGGNLLWLGVFMAMTLLVILGGVQKGIELAARVLLPVMFLLMIILAVRALLMDGAGQALDFVFMPHADRMKPSSVLEAMGQAFFSLSLGMGAMLTYGSYLSRRANIITSSGWITLLDTFVALIAAVIIFPILFTFVDEPQAGPGLVFQTMPILFSQMPMGWLVSVMFFTLLLLAALTSSISLLEVVTATAIDTIGMTRRTAAIVATVGIAVLGVPCALSGSDSFWGRLTILDKNFFDFMDYLAANWALPLGGLLIALFVGWFMNAERRRKELIEGTSSEMAAVWDRFYLVWLGLLRFVVPALVFLVLLNKIGVLKTEWIDGLFGG